MNFTNTNIVLSTAERICMTKHEFAKNFQDMCHTASNRPIIFMGVSLVLAILEPTVLKTINNVVEKNGKYLWKNSKFSIEYYDLFFAWRMAKLSSLFLAILFSIFGADAYVGG